MELTPYYGEQVLAPANVIVRVNPKDQKRADALLNRTVGIQQIQDLEDFEVAKEAAGQLKAFLNEIERGQKAAKEPFKVINERITEQARSVGGPIDSEHKRILSLLNSYVAQVEAFQKEAERKHAEALRLEREEHDRRIRAAQKAQLIAEEQARAAQDEAARERARADAQAQMLVAAQEQLAKELSMEADLIGANEPKKSLVPGGRVDHPFQFKLVNIRETINAGCLALLRWEIDHLACQDSVRGQLAIDPNCTPTLPGIEVVRTINVSVKANPRGL